MNKWELGATAQEEWEDRIQWFYELLYTLLW